MFPSVNLMPSLGTLGNMALASSPDPLQRSPAVCKTVSRFSSVSHKAALPTTVSIFQLTLVCLTPSQRFWDWFTDIQFSPVKLFLQYEDTISEQLPYLSALAILMYSKPFITLETERGAICWPVSSAQERLASPRELGKDLPLLGGLIQKNLRL